ncbi:MAG: leucine-rich repeat domain-containing protein [Rikenellaceae bacterium]
MNNSKRIDELLSIETKWDATLETCGDENDILYSKNGDAVVHIYEYLEDGVVKDGVKIICDKANQFDEAPYLTNLKLPESLVAIGHRAFYYAQSLDSINIPLSVEIIKQEAFDSSSIKILPANNNIKVIEYKAFNDSYLEGALNIKNTEYLGDFAFGSTNITSVELSESLEAIGDCAFVLCPELKSITIPASVKHIGGGAFSSCNNLKNITLLCDNYILEDGVIYNADKTELVSAISVQEEFTIPNTVETICNYAFYSSAVTSITIPKSVKKISVGAFSYSELKTAKIPNSVTEIGKQAFLSCCQLTEVKLPKQLKVLADELFNECDKLTKITLPSAFTHIGEYTFSSCSLLKNIKLPETLEVLGKGCFEWSSINSINIPDKVTKIPDFAFYYCELKSIVIPDSVTEICDSAFEHCDKLDYVRLPESLVSISETAFKNCSNEIYFALAKQSSIHELVNSTLSKTENKYFSTKKIEFKIITERKHPKIFKRIDYIALGSPSSFEIADGIEKIADDTFWYGDIIKSITIPNSLKEIEWYTFEITGLKSIYIYEDNPTKEKIINMYGKRIKIKKR